MYTSRKGITTADLFALVRFLAMPSARASQTVLAARRGQSKPTVTVTVPRHSSQTNKYQVVARLTQHVDTQELVIPIENGRRVPRSFRGRQRRAAGGGLMVARSGTMDQAPPLIVTEA
ncbi:hypothetical protein E2C01_068779 [Portunus trituberculatus]|uniref:Uncharacterized protein n=1 Tax=Portunus trituberculatus TaxID=210409 RepID=A0A5B7HPQ2_PORTR|nr:hypothetical protein [Portunus trituberculatus]